MYGSIVRKRNELFGQGGLGGKGLQVCALGRLGDFSTASDEFLKRTKLDDERPGGFFADTLASGDIVTGVAREGEDVGNAGRFDLESRNHVVDGDKMGTLVGFGHRIKETYRIDAVLAFDELHEILVACRNDDVPVLLSRLPGEGGNDVIGFIPLGIVGMKPKRIRDFSEPWKLQDEGIRRSPTLGFVLRVKRMSEFGSAHLVRQGDGIGMDPTNDGQNHRSIKMKRIGRESLAVVHGGRREKGAENVV